MTVQEPWLCTHQGSIRADEFGSAPEFEPWGRNLVWVAWDSPPQALARAAGNRSRKAEGICWILVHNLEQTIFTQTLPCLCGCWQLFALSSTSQQENFHLLLFIPVFQFVSYRCSSSYWMLLAWRLKILCCLCQTPNFHVEADVGKSISVWL